MLWTTAIAIGLRYTVGQLIHPFVQTRLMIKALLLNLVIVPLGVWVLTQSLPVPPDVVIGLLLLAAAAGGPFGLTATQLAHGDVAFALALVAILQVARIVTIPFWLGVFLPFGLSEVVQVVVSLVLYILLPLAVGLVLRRFLRDRSLRWSLNAQRAGSALIVVVIVSAILLYRSALASLAFSWTMLMILGIQFLGGGLGYVLGGPEMAGRRTVALTTIVRSSAAALLIADRVYPDQPLVAATILTYSVVALSVAALAAASMGRLHRMDSIQLPVESSE